MSQNCRVIQLLEPFDDTLVATPSEGNVDKSYDEAGSEALAIGQLEVSVVFATPKVNEEYEFRALYIEAIGQATPSAIVVVPVTRTTTGFTVELSAGPDTAIYMLRWHVHVTDLTVVQPTASAPESGRTQLTLAAIIQTIPFTIVRVNATYGFLEFRVENLIDDPSTQSSTWVQVTAKTTTSFTISINPPPDTVNYYLVWRTT